MKKDWKRSKLCVSFQNLSTLAKVSSESFSSGEPIEPAASTREIACDSRLSSVTLLDVFPDSVFETSSGFCLFANSAIHLATGVMEGGVIFNHKLLWNGLESPQRGVSRLHRLDHASIFAGIVFTLSILFFLNYLVLFSSPQTVTLDREQEAVFNPSSPEEKPYHRTSGLSSPASS